MKIIIVEESYYAPVIKDPKLFFAIVSKPYGVTKIGKVDVFDKDPKDIHQFKITWSDSLVDFSIQPMTGVIEGKPKRGSYKLSVEVTDGKYSDSSVFEIIVNELTNEVKTKSVVLTINGVDPKTFMESKMTQFVLLLARVTGSSINDVFIWSVQSSSRSSKRQRRSAIPKTLIAVAVKNNDNLVCHNETS